MANSLIVCGGTFDHFHKGHKEFLKYAFSLGEKVIVGVTSDSFIKRDKRKATSEKQIEPFEKRKQNVLEFIKSKGVLERVAIVEINDLFGPTLSKDLPIDGVVVSKDTKKGAKYINRKRKELGLSPLKIFIVSFIQAEDERLISSQRIRNGEIDREGKVYVKDAWFKKNLKLTADLRKKIKKPFGELLKDLKDLFGNKNCLIITVGDITTRTFNEKSLGQKLSVIDFKVARKTKFSNILELGFAGSENVLQIDNPAGYITPNLFRIISEIFKSGIKGKVILQINGEEDLAVLPLVLLAPLNTIIYYGQPNKGVVKVVVSEDSKSKAYELINGFRVIDNYY